MSRKTSTKITPGVGAHVHRGISLKLSDYLDNFTHQRRRLRWHQMDRSDPPHGYCVGTQQILSVVKRLGKQNGVSAYNVAQAVKRDHAIVDRTKVRILLEEAVHKGLLKRSGSFYRVANPKSEQPKESNSFRDRRGKRRSRRRRGRSRRRSSRRRHGRIRRPSRRKIRHRHPLSYFKKPETKPNIREKPKNKIKRVRRLTKARRSRLVSDNRNPSKPYHFTFNYNFPRFLTLPKKSSNSPVTPADTKESRPSATHTVVLPVYTTPDSYRVRKDVHSRVYKVAGPTVTGSDPYKLPILPRYRRDYT
ncbi:hypothetical protein J6590_001901 [Homalodisca vitripennis]|nr:hypothetical protein J6590_001901 [Homalodisca vitripennis]